jgi:hypothetical protein
MKPTFLNNALWYDRVGWCNGSAIDPIREVLGSNLGRDTGYPDWAISRLFLVHQGKLQDSASKWSRFRLSRSFPIQYSPLSYHSILYDTAPVKWATDIEYKVACWQYQELVHRLTRRRHNYRQATVKMNTFYFKHFYISYNEYLMTLEEDYGSAVVNCIVTMSKSLWRWYISTNIMF